MTKKETLIADIEQHKEDDSRFIARGKLVTGEETIMHFSCSRQRLQQVISQFFSADLQGSTPGGVETVIESWEWVS